MAKTATSGKRKKFNKKYLTEYVPFSNPRLADPKWVSELLIECLRDGDTCAFHDVLMSHILTTRKADFAKKAGLGRRTIYAILDPKRKFNPELDTVAAIIRALAS